MSDLSIDKIKQQEQIQSTETSSEIKKKEEESIYTSDKNSVTDEKSVSIHTDTSIDKPDFKDASIHTQEKNKASRTSTGKTSEVDKAEEVEKTNATNPIANKNIFDGQNCGENSDTFVSHPAKTSTVRSIVEKDLSAKAKENGKLLETHCPELMKEISSGLTEGVYKESDIQEALATMKEAAASQDIEWDNIPSELKIAQLELILQHKTGKLSDAKFAELKSKYNAIFASKILLSHLPKDASKVDRAKVKATLEEFAKFSGAVDIAAVKSLKGMTPDETKRLREDFIVFLSKHSEKEQKMIMEYIVENFPENCTEDNAKVILEEAQNYAKVHLKGLEDHVKNGGYSEKLLSNFSKIKSSVFSNLDKWTKTFIEKFWKSEKGKAIKSYTINVLREYIHDKENAEAVKTKADEAKTEAKNAQKQAEIAMANAKKAMNEGKSIIANLGINPDKLNQQQGYSLLKNASPLSALKCKRAYYAEKSAKHDVAMADITNKCAQERAAWADKMLAFAEARVAILLSKNKILG